MDKQLALMKRYQKDENIIAYVHNGEIVLIKRVETELFEIILDSTTESLISKRKLAESEITIKQFEALKRRRGHKKAIIAIARTLLTAIYNILKKN